jgi:hypothetical protein
MEHPIKSHQVLPILLLNEKVFVEATPETGKHYLFITSFQIGIEGQIRTFLTI